MTVGSLFAGIGGFDLGFERAGFDVRWQVEIDPFCRAVLRKHWPGARRYGDVRRVGAHNLESVDVICGGFPCQPISGAGLKLVDNDKRWLWPEFARIIGALRPRIVLLENVSDLLKRGLSLVLGDLAASGYDAEWQCLPAAAFGAPHLRDRIWILAYPRSFDGGVTRGLKETARRPYMFPQRDWSDATERREDRELVALVPGVHPRMAEDWWRDQSRMARSAHGIPNGVHRNCSLGNSIVPQIAEWIARRIQAAEVTTMSQPIIGASNRRGSDGQKESVNVVRRLAQEQETPQ